MVLVEYQWILIAGIIAALFTSFGIGANDVANAFATSVGSKSLTLLQAVLIASVCEFAGAVLLGGAVANTIRKNLVDLSVFEGSPGYLMFGMLCAIVGSGGWLLTATALKMPVSTTHSIVGATIGVFLVAGGPQAVNWPTVYMIIISWFSSPVISGLITASMFLFVRTFLLRHKRSFDRTCVFYPILVRVTVAVNVFFVMFKGMKNTIKKLTTETGVPFPEWAGVLLSLGVGLIAGLLIHFFLVPVLKRRLDKWEQEENEKNRQKEDEKADLEQGEKGDEVEGKEKVDHPEAEKEEGCKDGTASVPAAAAAGGRGVELAHVCSSDSSLGADDGEGDGERREWKENESEEMIKPVRGSTCGTVMGSDDLQTHAVKEEEEGGKDKAAASSMKKKKTLIKTAEELEDNAKKSKAVEDIHSKAEVFDEKTEHMYGYLQVFTAIFDSFAHGSNDVANAVGPLAAIYAVYMSGSVMISGGVPEWILAVGGAGIIFGLAIYGHRLIQVLGLELVKVTPSRGFCIELGTAFTTVVFSLVGIPISTTQCQVGFTAAAGWMEGRWDSVNLWVLGKTFFGWIITLAMAAGFSALLFYLMGFGKFIPSRGE
uniref:Phosphate transporter n=1 Tax=Chromera velia CCMP2878 TaxID=1169474 RepID=A0A0G4HAJ6_9ALVE|eukprot:Cvel_6107.t1-p1 / transcript=Cvel_6107.t1 / gene=Cvel_6107 / organism=Chromera_velia_CCMP2878 / gene_product=Sodium-dependent phosphate transporter 2, putative / transcript_product=Sodium-dependent phosphate transporter 2, putative / location=Cvel_scaffold294:94462-97411(-) / protein_length=598 / sequence_SO=supercontig / SO=protein_coding / is_pseudo=false